MNKDTFAIYQVKEGSETRDFRFEPLERLKAAGLAVDYGNYKHVYTGMLEPGGEPVTQTLNALYEKFDLDHPEDFPGRSLSISDILVLRCDGKATAYYVDSVEFKEMPEFLQGPYKYYSTQRPIGIGTFPKSDNEPIGIENFDSRKPVEGGAFQAWGVLTYKTPLTQKQMDDYELRAAPGNPDHVKLAPEQLEARLDIIGKWEQSKRIPDIKRLTWFHPDFGVFVKKELVTHEEVMERYAKIVESKARAANNKADKNLNAE